MAIDINITAAETQLGQNKMERNVHINTSKLHIHIKYYIKYKKHHLYLFIYKYVRHIRSETNALYLLLLRVLCYTLENSTERAAK